MHVRCPHCHNPVEILDNSSFKDILCSTCGSSFSLVGDAEATETARMASKRIGQFELVEQLGVGAFGTVWKAKDTQLDRIVAIKIPRKGQLSDAETEQFLREARAAAQLRHPNIVSVHEVGKSDDSVYIVSDYVEGADLKEWMRGQPLPPKEAAELCAKIAEALHHAHEQGVIHRDLKPGNIMMDLKGQPHIMDFGLAKRESGEMTMTVDGAILGTPAYMSPEQAKGEGHRADRRSDVYSLGTMLFEMLTGELPFRGEKRILIVSILTQEPPKLRRLNPRVPKDLETICLKCMEKEAERRYGSGRELEDDLRRYLIGEPIAARPVSAIETAWRWSKRHPMHAGLVFTGSLALIAMIVLAFNYRFSRRVERLNNELVAQNGQLVDAQQFRDRVLYFRNVSQALSAWYDGEVNRTKRLLEKCEIEPRHWEWHYTNQLFDRSVTTLRGHRGWVTSLAVSPDGRTLVTGSFDQSVKVWDLAKRRELLTLEGHRGYVIKTAFNQDGAVILSASSGDNAILSWDAATGNRLAEFHYTGQFAFGPGPPFAFGPNGKVLLTANASNGVDLWEATSGKTLATSTGHSAPVTSVALTADGKLVASGNQEGMIALLDTNTEGAPQNIRAHAGPVGCLRFSPAGDRLLTTPRFVYQASDKDRDERITIWNTKDWERVCEIDAPIPQTPNGLAFSPTAQIVAIADDRAVKIFDSGSGQQLRVLRGHRGFVTTIAFKEDGDRIVTGANDHLIKLWDANTAEELSTLKGHTGQIHRAEFAGDSQVVSVSRDKTARVWDLPADQEARTLVGHSDSVMEVAFSPDGALIASGSLDSSVRLWNAGSGELVHSLRAHESGITSLAFSADGSKLVSGSIDQTAIAWDVEAGERIQTLHGHTGRINGVAFSPDGAQIATGSGDKTVRVWHGQTGSELVTFDGHTEAVTCVAFSADGERILSGQIMRTAETPAVAKIWRVKDATELVELRGHTHNVQHVAFFPDGRRVATASFDHSVRIWDSTSGKEILKLDADSFVRRISISPDGLRIAAASRRDLVKLWDADHGHEAATLKGHTGNVQAVSFSPDGRLIASGSDDRTVRIWDAGTTFGKN